MELITIIITVLLFITTLWFYLKWERAVEHNKILNKHYEQLNMECLSLKKEKEDMELQLKTIKQYLDETQDLFTYL